MTWSAFVTLAAVTLSPTPPAGPPSPAPPRAAIARQELRRIAGPPASDLYSLRARRRIAVYLRLRLLEMREAGLERAAAAVERRLPADALVPK
jgi:hypothetical protein